MTKRMYGGIPGYPPRSHFANREELAAAGVHRPLRAGISGGKDGADSIVVSGGYIDDKDYGDELIYTGHGGNDPETRRQVADQQLTHGNAGLARSQLEGYPIRVIRGAGGHPDYSPRSGYRYDGLFRVAEHWRDAGVDGYRIWRFRLVTLESTDAPSPLAGPVEATPRGATVIQRLIRSTSAAQRVKQLHHHECQVCGTALETPAGCYAEAAHIRPLGRPHNGPDTAGNILCLCPNHHVLFDTGAIYITPHGMIYDTATNSPLGYLHTVPGHPIDWDQVTYHRDTHRFP